MSMNGALFKPVYGTAEQINAAVKEPGKIYFSTDGGVQVATESGAGTNGLKTISYPVAKVDELLEEKADVADLKEQVEESIAEQLGSSKEEFEELKGLIESLKGEEGDALKNMSANIQKNTSDISALTPRVDTLETGLASKADHTEIESLSSTIAEQGGSITDMQSQLSGLTTAIDDKADATAVTAVDEKADKIDKRVDTVEQSLGEKANASDLENIESQLSTKLDSEALSDYLRTEDAESTYLKSSDKVTTETLEGALTSINTLTTEVTIMGEKVDEIETISGQLQSVSDSVDGLTSQLSSKANADDLDQYAKKEDLASKADASALKDYLREDDLDERLSEKGYVESSTLESQLAAKADKSDLEGYVTEEDLSTKIDEKMGDDYLKKSELDDQISEEVQSQMGDYIKKSELGEQVSQEVTNQLGEYVTREDLSEEVTSAVSEQMGDYLTKSEASSTYIETETADETYVKKSAIGEELESSGALGDYLKTDEFETQLSSSTTLQQYTKTESLPSEIENVLDEKDYIDQNTADSRYVQASEAETSFIHATETRSEEIIDGALESLRKIKATVELEHGMDITLAEDTDTVTIKGQHDSKVEIGGVGNIRVIPSTSTDALNEEGEFTSAFAIVDPSTDKAVNAIGFVGKPKVETIASRKKRAIATLAAGGVVDDSTVSIEYLYLGFNPETGEPLVKVTTDGKVYIGNDETDIVSKIAALEARIAALEGSQGPDLDIADDQAVSDGLGEIFQG